MPLPELWCLPACRNPCFPAREPTDSVSDVRASVLCSPLERLPCDPPPVPRQHVGVYAAYLYDSVMMYARALNRTISDNPDVPLRQILTNGSEIVLRIRNQIFHSECRPPPPLIAARGPASERPDWC